MLWNVKEDADLVFGAQKGRGGVCSKLCGETVPQKNGLAGINGYW